MEIFFISIYLLLAFLVAWHEGKHRKCGFVGALVLMILLSPFFGYLAMVMFPLKEPVGCKWCGNKENEAEYCGICNKDKEGNLRPAQVVNN